MNTRHPFLLLLLCSLWPGMGNAKAQADVAGTPASATVKQENIPVDAMPVMAKPESDTATAPAVAEPAYAAELRGEVKAVLKGEEFHQHSSDTVPVLRPWLAKWLKPEKKREEKNPSMPDFSTLAQVLKVVVIALLVLALAWLLWRGWQWLSPQMGADKKIRAQGKALEAASRPLQNTALPDQVSTAAAHAWQQGKHALALSLLYRGAVQTLASRYQLTLPAGATEGEYLRSVRRRGNSTLLSGFTLIVQAWTALAYANRRPDDFASLLQTYRQHFEHEDQRAEAISTGPATSTEHGS